MNSQLMHFGIYIYIQMYVSLSISLSSKSVITSFDQRRPASLSNTINKFLIILCSTLSSERLTAVNKMRKQGCSRSVVFDVGCHVCQRVLGLARPQVQTQGPYKHTTAEKTTIINSSHYFSLSALSQPFNCKETICYILQTVVHISILQNSKPCLESRG